MEKVAILYICTGKYIVFWDNFFATAEKYLLPNCAKTYFVFTDSEHLIGEEQAQVKKIRQPNLGWPGNTLFRYQMFRPFEHELREFDYVLFFNANILFLDYVYEYEFLPRQEGLAVVNHPLFYNKDPHSFPYERNPASLAYVPWGHGTFYCLGGINGGRSADYVELIILLEQAIHHDCTNGIIAVWFDESHFNKYVMGREVKLLTPSFGYAEDVSLPFPPKILIMNKIKWGGHQYLRT